jgi:HAMP domain-containing protein
MKIEDIQGQGFVALGLLGLAGLTAGAAVAFAAGVALGRDPEAIRRAVKSVARGTARGLGEATLLAEQMREHVADLWAEAREEAIASVDDADFERTARSAAAATAGIGPVTSTPTDRGRKAAAKAKDVDAPGPARKARRAPPTGAAASRGAGSAARGRRAAADEAPRVPAPARADDGS